MSLQLIKNAAFASSSLHSQCQPHNFRFRQHSEHKCCDTNSQLNSKFRTQLRSFKSDTPENTNPKCLCANYTTHLLYDFAFPALGKHRMLVRKIRSTFTTHSFARSLSLNSMYTQMSSTLHTCVQSSVVRDSSNFTILHTNKEHTPQRKQNILIRHTNKHCHTALTHTDNRATEGKSTWLNSSRL